MDILLTRGYTTFVRVDSGGQGNVYRTIKNDKLFAIKVVPIDKRRDGTPAPLEDDLKRELTITRGLRHPNCIRVEEIFRTKVISYKH